VTVLKNREPRVSFVQYMKARRVSLKAHPEFTTQSDDFSMEFVLSTIAFEL
jgi:hypothetical protein